MTPQSITARAHEWIAPALAPGAVAIDATAGTGADTAFLATRVAPGGIVHAFDIQPAALERSRARLADQSVDAALCWHIACHSTLSGVLGGSRAAAVMFNLGWLPGGDHRLITRPETTCAALEAAAAAIAPGGRISVVAYRGHPGGQDEYAAVAAWLQRGAHGLIVHDPLPASASAVAPVLYRIAAPA